jgi:transposase InsO family protein
LKHSHFAKQLPAFKELLQQFDGWDRSSFEDSKFSADVVSTVKAIGSQPVRTAFRSPWQNGIAERWVGSVRRDLFDHMIVMNERHLRRLLKGYVRYYHEDRTLSFIKTSYIPNINDLCDGWIGNVG